MSNSKLISESEFVAQILEAFSDLCVEMSLAVIEPFTPWVRPLVVVVRGFFAILAQAVEPVNNALTTLLKLLGQLGQRFMDEQKMFPAYLTAGSIVIVLGVKIMVSYLNTILRVFFPVILVMFTTVFIAPIVFMGTTSSAVVIITQSFIRKGPFSASGWPGRTVADAARCMRLKTQKPFYERSLMVIWIWMPCKDLADRFLRRFLTVRTAMGRVARSTETVSNLKVCRLAWKQAAAVSARTSETVEGFSNIIPGLSAARSIVSSMISEALWGMMNSSRADAVAGVVRDVKWATRRAVDVSASIARLIIAGGLLSDEHLRSYDGRLPRHISGALIQAARAAWESIVTGLGSFIDPFTKHHISVTADEVSRMALLNMHVYDGIPLARKGEDAAKPGVIRVLTLLPDNVPNQQRVRCVLGIEELSDATYEALSYVWGPLEADETISVNDAVFRVSSSVLQALIHLRRHDAARRLWIDAVCINQSDMKERTSQVLLMGEIYSRASSVVIWMGEKEPWGLDKAIAATRVVRDDMGETLDGEVHVGVWNVMSDLLRRPWWNRVWVVQELVLAREVRLQCGNSWIHWDQFCLMVDASSIDSRKTYLDQFVALRQIRDTWAPTSPTLANRGYIASSTGESEEGKESHFTAMPKTMESLFGSTDIFYLAYMLRTRQATDPRDKVFAFLGLTGTGSTESQGTSILQPDYSRPANALSMDLARQHIRRSRSLSAVALVECARHIIKDAARSGDSILSEYVPSWCPAFMDIEAVNAGQARQPMWTGLGCVDGDLYFSAADGFGFGTGHVDSALKVLCETACYVGELEYGLRVQVLSNRLATIYDDGQIKGIAELAAQMETTMQWETIIPNRWKMAIEAARPVHEELLASGKGDDHYDLDAEATFHLTRTVGKFSALPPPGDKPARDRYGEALKSACTGRRLFSTSDGRLGLGPEDLEPGDKVCVLLGSQVPVVLRKVPQPVLEGSEVPDVWYYVGQAYIYEWIIYKGDLKRDIRDNVVRLEEHILI